MCHLPVENSRNVRNVRAEQRVLWSEVSVDDHVAPTFETRNDGGIKRLKLGQLGAGHPEDNRSEALVDEFLAVTTYDRRRRRSIGAERSNWTTSGRG